MSSKLQRLQRAHDQLLALRGSQDQTMRTQVIRIMFGPSARGGVNETQAFLEWAIAYTEKGIADHLTDLFDEE